jgi:hypothetical protein
LNHEEFSDFFRREYSGLVRHVVDLRLDNGAVGLRHERLRRAAALLDTDLRAPLEDVGADHRIRHSKTRLTVCRCLCGASRSTRRISSIVALNGSRREIRGGSCLRGAGHTGSSASATVLRLTPYLEDEALLDSPSTRASWRIDAYNPT